MGRLVSGCLMAIGAFVVLIVVGAIFVSSRSSGSGSGPSPLVSDQPAQQAAFSVVHDNTTYYGTIASDVGVAILGLRDAGPYLSGGFDDLVQADGKFIVVAVAIENRQSSAITMNESLFEIMDSAGNVYSASEKSMEVGTNNNLFLAQINPGITKNGIIVFDVPRTLGIDDLRLRFRGGMTGDSAVIPLKVNSVEPASAPVAPVAPSGLPDQPNNQNTATQPTIPLQSSSATPFTPISVGQTTEQVEAALGPPASVTTGAKHVYTYPHLVIVFVDDKVSEIHQIQ